VCDANLVECRATQGEDVERLVVEKVSGALVALQLAGDGALGPVRHSATIGVDQVAEKRSRMVVDDLLPPILECDRAGVFSAGTVVREEAGPVCGVTLDLGAADALDDTFDGGSTAPKADSTSARTPGNVSAQKIERQCTSRLPVVMWPSPRYCPSR
jgi:hypothetical protein